jgi:hypothetical protein
MLRLHSVLGMRARRHPAYDNPHIVVRPRSTHASMGTVDSEDGPARGRLRGRRRRPVRRGPRRGRQRWLRCRPGTQPRPARRAGRRLRRRRGLLGVVGAACQVGTAVLPAAAPARTGRGSTSTSPAGNSAGGRPPASACGSAAAVLGDSTAGCVSGAPAGVAPPRPAGSGTAARPPRVHRARREQQLR